jgi:hypothetical protein
MFDLVMRTSADEIADAHQHMKEHRRRIGFRIRFDGPHNTSGKAVIRLVY